MSLEGFYLDLMMTRGSDPAERRSPPELTTWRCLEVACGAWRQPAIALSSPWRRKGSRRILWWRQPWTKDSGTRKCGLGGLTASLHSTLKKEAFHAMSKTMIVILCYLIAMSIMIASMGAGV